jgi:hypothetical protein
MPHHNHMFGWRVSLDPRKLSRHLCATLEHREDFSFAVDEQVLHAYLLPCPAQTEA